MARNDALLTAKIVRCDEYALINLQSKHEMSRILKLVPHITPEIGHVPAHAKRRKRTKHARRVELPGVMGIIKVAMRSKVVVGDHSTFLHPTYREMKERCRFYILTVEPSSLVTLYANATTRSNKPRSLMGYQPDLLLVCPDPIAYFWHIFKSGSYIGVVFGQKIIALLNQWCC
jgi:hypothetical protein